MEAGMDRDPFDLIGDVLDGQFRVDAFAGEGDLSVVYKGHHLGVDAPVAIKCLNLPETLDRALARPLIDGFNEASRVHYRLARGNLHIAQTIASGSTLVPRSGVVVPYLVREWFEGESLASNLARRRSEKLSGRSVDEAFGLLETAFDGIAYAHAQGEVHLSINPSNLFVVEGAGAGEAPVCLKVLDFGVASTMNAIPSALPSSAQSARPSGGLRLLFPAYAAPEQLDRAVGALGPWTDVYALALVMMEVLSDRVVMGETETGAIVEHALDEQRRPTPQAHGLKLPSHIERALARAVARSPGRRQKTAAELWKDVRAAVRTLAPRAMSLAPPAPAHPAPRIVTPAPGRVRAPTLVGLSPPAVLSVPGASNRAAGMTSVVTKPMAFEPAVDSQNALAPQRLGTPLPIEVIVTGGAAGVTPSGPLRALPSARPLPPLSAPPPPRGSALPPARMSAPPAGSAPSMPPVSELPRLPLPSSSLPPIPSTSDSGPEAGPVLMDAGDPEPTPHRSESFLAFPFTERGAPIVLSVAGALFWIWAVTLFVWIFTLPLRHRHSLAAAPLVASAPLDAADGPAQAPSPPAAAESTAQAMGAQSTPQATAADSLAQAAASAPSSAAPAPSSSSSAQPSDAFRSGAAVRALDGRWRAIAKCRRGATWGKATTTVTFAGDGAVTHVDVGSPFTATPTGDCIASNLAGVRMQPFGADPAVLVYRVYVAPK
jgi:hypothetical protein